MRVLVNGVGEEARDGKRQLRPMLTDTDTVTEPSIDLGDSIRVEDFQ